MKLSGLAVSLAGFVVSLLSVPCTGAQQTAPGTDTLVRTSHIIFAGRVEKLRATNLKVVAPSESTILVKVEEPLDVPLSVASLKGEQVTVVVVQQGEFRPGDRAVFFANGLIFGEHLEVKEVGHIPPPSDLSGLRKQILAVRAQMSQEKLKARVESSALIITGKVLEVKPLPRVGGISEHQPDFAEAVVQVESVEKGEERGKTVAVDFPQSTDERWLLSPKFKAGEAGIWLLHHQANTGLPQGAWFALNPLDFQPLEQRATIRKLIH